MVVGQHGHSGHPAQHHVAKASRGDRGRVQIPPLREGVRNVMEMRSRNPPAIPSVQVNNSGLQ